MQQLGYIEGSNIRFVYRFADGFLDRLPDLAAKQLDMVRELLPHLARVAVLINITNPLHVPQWRHTQSAATRAAIALTPFEIPSPEQLQQAFTAFAQAQAEALLVPPDVTFNTYGRRIAELATTARLPAIFFRRELAEDGGLLSYGPNLLENYRRAAFFVDKILKGAKPGDLPVERPTQFELVINLKTAKALGLEIPQTLLARAEDVIE